MQIFLQNHTKNKTFMCKVTVLDCPSGLISSCFVVVVVCGAFGLLLWSDSIAQRYTMLINLIDYSQTFYSYIPSLNFGQLAAKLDRH